MLQLKIKLKNPGEKSSYSTITENIRGSLSNVDFEILKLKYEIDGVVIKAWQIAEQLPFEEGHAAAMAGSPSNTNPYAKPNWKHKEWHTGWISHHESN